MTASGGSGAGRDGDAGPGEDTDPGEDRSFLAAFRIRPFRWIWAAVLSGNSGRFAVLLVAAWQAFRLTHSALWSSVVAFAVLVPTVVVSPVAGAAADRHSRAHQVVVGQGLCGAVCVAAAVLADVGRLGLVAVIVTTLLVGAGNAIQNPAWSSLVPDLIGRRRLVNGGLMVRIAQQGSELVGPALGTPLLLRTGPAGTYLLAAALYATGCACAWRTRAASRRPAAGGRGVIRPVWAGIRYVATVPVLSALLVVVTLHCGLTMAYTGVLPTFASSNLAGAAGVYGALLAAVGAGAIGGPILIAATARRTRLSVILAVTGVLSGLALAWLGLSTSTAGALAAAVVVGGSQSGFMAAYYSWLQGAADPGMRGRVSGFSNIVIGASMSTTALGWGALVGVIPPGWVLAAPGLLFVACYLVAAVASADLRPLRTAPSASPGAAAR